jgi:2-polyprenyl-3-methyl-5-hydroxy-6-metoxy-1,4-benzoquinol methylase
MITVNEHINSWKSKEVFEKQLHLNKKELDNYPPHWYSFLKLINTLDIKENFKLLDIGCGVGVYSELCHRHIKNICYTGIDYSEEAILIAKNNWNNGSTFIIKDINDIDYNFLSKYDLIHMGALLDVLPNADDVLDLILKFSIKNILISRIDIDDNKNCYTYTAYDEILTYKYVHSKDNLLKIIYNNNYKILSVDGNNLLLEKLK